MNILFGGILSHSIYTILQITYPYSIVSQWGLFALIIASLLFTIAAIVYVLSGILNSSRAKAWARFQIYEIVLTLILIAAFISLSGLFLLNPQGAFSNVLGIVPSACSSTNTIFTLASCDLSQFQLLSFKVSNYFFLFGPFLSISPGTNVGYELGAAGLKLTLGTTYSILPSSSQNGAEIGFLVFITTLILNQVQLFIVSSAPLFLSLFIVIGLTARATGFGRRFGGTMIGFGIGIGLLYPLLVSITYGFIMVHLTTLVSSLPPSFTLTFAKFIISTIYSALKNIVTLGLPSYISSLFTILGYLIAGAVFIPLLNFIILEAFIVDFSRAMGEQMSFISVFQHLI